MKLIKLILQINIAAILCIVVSAFLGVGTVFAQEKGAFDGSLSISGTITGFKKGAGIYIALYDSQQNFKNKKFTNALRIPADSVRTDSITYKLNNIKTGQYLIVAYQDLNNDTIINTNLFGMPTEPYLFYTPVKAMQRPMFSNCKFTLNTDLTNVNLTFINVRR
jgi:uncharacterized protein (DUF2141 family)